MAHDIYEVLADEALCYEELLEIGKAKREILVKNDTKTLKAMNLKEEALLGRHRKLEKRRLETLKELAASEGISPGQITLDWLLEKLGDSPASERLAALRSRMRAAASSLKEVNEGNMKLIQSNLDYIECTMNLLREASQQSAFDVLR
ncbi:MAG: flagellar protein FlgN [Clostridiales bacterium]|jgi:aryl-alcohol dehydrogenase-like predicted oxidoreductase|nr:flagellar protein FlgN [Clostridiales bacterium]